jgi:CubicO group peptidase (beta-lactamase class C family)
MGREKIPGLAVGIYSRGKMLLAKGYGLANVELAVPVKPETLFQSGSVGKQFVSAAIMMLAEDGKLSLDDSVSKYFADAPDGWKPILIKNLLSHTSGLAEYESRDRVQPNGPFYLRLDMTEDELLKRIEAMPIEGAPGDVWAYRNTNYALLGILIHKVTGIPYTEFLANRIFQPLGMTSTRPISEADIIPNRAAGYRIVKGQIKNQAWVSPTFNSTADGTLYFNVLDLAKWDEALYSTHLLTEESSRRMWTVFLLNNGTFNSGRYGFGWEITKQRGHTLLEHDGAWQGFSCVISRYPDDSLTIAVLTNLDAGHAQPSLFSHSIAEIVEPSLDRPAIPDTEPDVAVILSGLLDRLAAGKDIHDQLATDFVGDMPPQRIKIIQAALSQLWPGGRLTLVERQTNPTTMSIYRLAKPGGENTLIYFSLNADGRVHFFSTAPDRE